MGSDQNKIGRFWYELKRRKVLKTVAMYAPAAFVLLEVVDIITPPLGLPPWTLTLVIIIIAAGFPVTVILSWIFDITPEGVRKTNDLDPSSSGEQVTVQDRRKLRVSDVVIAILIIAVVVLAWPKIFNRDQLRNVRDEDGKISVAVMPFGNSTGDTLFNIWQDGFQNLLISNLSNSEELSVRKYQAINNVLENNVQLNFASLTPGLTKEISDKLDAKTMITGNILKAGHKIRINAQLVEAGSNEIYKTYQVDGNSEDELFAMADSLSAMIKNYIEIKNITDRYNSPELRGISYTTSSEAFKYYIHGLDAFKYIELESAVEWFSKAVEADSTFINAYVYAAYANLMFGSDRQAKQWCNLAYNKRNGLPTEEKLIVDQLNAYFNETPHEEIKYVKQLIEMDDKNPLYWHMLGFAHYKLMEYEDAVKSWEEVFRIHEKWGTDYMNPYIYFLMGDAYHQLNEHEKEEKILALGLSLFPEAVMIMQYQAICAFSQGDMEKGEAILVDYKSTRQNILHCTEAMISTGVGVIYSEAGLLDKAEEYYRNAIEVDQENLNWVHNFAWFLIDNDVNVEEGLKMLARILKLYPNYWPSLDAKGWGLYKQGKYEEALKLLKDAWDLKPVYSYRGYLHIQEVEKALASQPTE